MADVAPVERARAAAASVPDPEVPALTIADLGVLHRVEIAADGAVEVAILPTYSGCPAMGVIALGVETALVAAGFPAARVRLTHSPAWSSDMISAAGREKLREAGIAPPPPGSGKRALFADEEPAACPRCGSARTAMISPFGSTACKAMWRCESCREPFEQFKCI
jgi:ring-1,2-phenylacetyl-CoA epoxidase subunit PaaD